MDDKIKSYQPALPWFVEEYFIKKNISSRTKKIYKSEFIFFFNWLSSKNLSNSILSQITLEELDKLSFKHISSYKHFLENYKDHTRKRDSFHQVTIARKLSSISSLFQYLSVTEFSDGKCYLENNWFHYLKKNDRPKSPYLKAKEMKKELLLSFEEFRDFKDFVANKYHKNLRSNRQINHYHKYKVRDTAIVSLLLFSGISLEELVNLKVEDIYINSKTLNIKLKDGSNRTITLYEDSVKDLENYLIVRRDYNPTCSFVFLSKYNNEYSQMAIRTIQDIIAKYSKSYNKIELSAQKLRHSFAVVLFSRTHNLSLLQKELGQESINTAWIYTKLYNERDNNLYKV